MRFGQDAAGSREIQQPQAAPPCPSHRRLLGSRRLLTRATVTTPPPRAGFTPQPPRPAPRQTALPSLLVPVLVAAPPTAKPVWQVQPEEICPPIRHS